MRPFSALSIFPRSWQRTLGGLFAALLLLPVPAYAAIAFTGSWSNTSNTPIANTPINSASSFDLSSFTVLTLGWRDNQQYTGGGSVTFSHDFNVTGSATNLNLTIQTLERFYSFGGEGSVVVSTRVVELDDDPVVNMFGATYNSSNPPPSSNITDFESIAVGSYKFELTFTFTGPFTTYSTPTTVALN